MNGLIIEGVAGTGKSTIVSLFKSHSELKVLKPSLEFIDEDQTTGELVAELQNSQLSDEARHYRLHKLIPIIQHQNMHSSFTILERFHPTYFALIPNSQLFKIYDDILSELNFGLVLLDLPNDDLLGRSFFRPEMEGQNWSESLKEWYGSQDAAINAFIASQQRRRDFLQKTKLKHLRIETTERDWKSYVDSIVHFVTE